MESTAIKTKKRAKYIQIEFRESSKKPFLSTKKSTGNTTKKTKKTLINNTFKYLLCIDLNSISVISGKEVTGIF
jgi:hypothetical protein